MYAYTPGEFFWIAFMSALTCERSSLFREAIAAFLFHNIKVQKKNRVRRKVRSV
jgi:hypothetical protein